MIEEAKYKAIRNELTVGYSAILDKVRKRVKGLRTQHLSFIILVGDNHGATLSELSHITGRPRNNLNQVLRRGIQKGYLFKDSTRYYLTDKGRSSYDGICSEFDIVYQKALNTILDEAKKRGKKG